jgi:transposase
MEHQEKEIKFLDREKKTQTFDKRLIQQIVKAVEDGMPRKQAMAVHGMGSSSLSEWMRLYGSTAYHAGKRKIYTSSEKRSVLRAVESGMSIRKAQISFGIKGAGTIRTWFKDAKQENTDLSLYTNAESMGKPAKDKESDEVKALKKALAQAELKVKALDTMIDIAQEQLKVDIRKKSGARQSQK